MSQEADVAGRSPYPWAEGGVISSARDLDRLLTAVFVGRLLPAAEVADLTTAPDAPSVGTNDCRLGGPGRASFGMGLMRAAVDGVTVWGRTGSRPTRASSPESRAPLSADRGILSEKD